MTSIWWCISDVSRLLAGDLSIVSPGLLSALSGVANSQVQEMLERLGVKHITTRDIIEHQILPAFSFGQWEVSKLMMMMMSYLCLQRSWRWNVKLKIANKIWQPVNTAASMTTVTHGRSLSYQWKVWCFFQSKSRQTVINYVIFLHEYIQETQAVISLEDLADVIQLSTNQGMKNPSRDAIHFSPNYGNRIDLANQFKGWFNSSRLIKNHHLSFIFVNRK